MLELRGVKEQEEGSEVGSDRARYSQGMKAVGIVRI